MGVDHEIKGLVLLLAEGEELRAVIMVLGRAAPRPQLLVVVLEIPLERGIRSGVAYLPKDAGQVARLLEGLKHGGDLLRQLDESVDAAVVAVETRGDDAATGNADRGVHEAVLEAEALGGEFVEIGSHPRHFAGPLALQKVRRLVPHVIGGDQKHIQGLLRGVKERHQGQNKGQGQSKG